MFVMYYIILYVCTVIHEIIYIVLLKREPKFIKAFLDFLVTVLLFII